MEELIGAIIVLVLMTLGAVSIYFDENIKSNKKTGRAVYLAGIVMGWLMMAGVWILTIEILEISEKLGGI